MSNISNLLLISLLCLLFTNAHGQYLTLQKLSVGINTAGYDEISPVVGEFGNTLFFTRVGYPEFDKTLIENGRDLNSLLPYGNYSVKLADIYNKIGGKASYPPYRSHFNQDIWIASSHNSEFDKVEHPGYPLNNALPNSVSEIAPNGQGIILINQFPKEGGMKKGFSTSHLVDNKYWSYPEPLEIENYYNTGSDVNLTMSRDQMVIIISTERDDSYGGNDLYVCFKTGDNKYSSPVNMGPQINSAYKESTPHLSEDGEVIFFASNRPGSMGKNDIYLSRKLDDSYQNWSVLERFITPINSTADDIQPFFNTATGYLYFASTREGSSDIFRVKIAEQKKETVVVKGKLIDYKTEDKLEEVTVYAGADFPGMKVPITKDGEFALQVPKGVNYKIKAQKPGYYDLEESLYYKTNFVYVKDRKINLEMKPMSKGDKIKIKPIYFVKSKPTILESSHAALDELATFLKTNRLLNIEIQGHTDNQGDEVLLQQLSEDRAEAIKNYLVYEKRIHPLRVEAKGFGSKYPTNKNKTEVERKKNRRVEIVISKVKKQTKNMAKKF